MIDKDIKSFEFTVKYKMADDGTKWNVSIESPENIDLDDCIKFMMNLAWVKQEREYNNFIKERKDWYKKLKWLDKCKYNLGILKYK